MGSQYKVLLKEGIWGKVKKKRLSIIHYPFINFFVAMWKRTFKWGIALGAVSFGLFFVSSLANNYGFNFSGFDLKTSEVLGAFGIAITIGVIAIAIFNRRCLKEK
ncbi:MAG: hypothetical protein WC241_01395 [Candidatus Paceibacterota bacterium]|jgi:hypothetical protein